MKLSLLLEGVCNSVHKENIQGRMRVLPPFSNNHKCRWLLDKKDHNAGGSDRQEIIVPLFSPLSFALLNSLFQPVLNFKNIDIC